MSPAAKAQRDPGGAVPDLALVGRMARGDQEALGELRSRYAATMYALAFGLLSNPPDAEHVLSETFLEAWRCAATFEPQLGTVHSWLAEIARRRARSLARAPETGRATVRVRFHTG